MTEAELHVRINGRH